MEYNYIILIYKMFWIESLPVTRQINLGMRILTYLSQKPKEVKAEAADGGRVEHIAKGIAIVDINLAMAIVVTGAGAGAGTGA